MNINELLNLYDNEKIIKFVLRKNYTITENGIESNEIIKGSKETAKKLGVKDVVVFNETAEADFYSVLTFADVFVFEGKKDWRLPTVEEMKTIIMTVKERTDVPARIREVKGKVYQINYSYNFNWKFYTSERWHKKWVQMCELWFNKVEIYRKKPELFHCGRFCLVRG